VTPGEIANLKLQARIERTHVDSAETLLAVERFYRQQAEKRLDEQTPKATATSRRGLDRIDCRSFRDHAIHHGLIGDRWVCEICSPASAA
jgi:hypothetical protein